MDKNGFTLIELMVTVAIVGILATFAIPQYQRYKNKSRQSEAKIGLLSVYEAQEIFRLEHQTYYNNLWATGYQPFGRLRYAAYIFFETGTIQPEGFDSALLAKGAYRSTLQICGFEFSEGISQDCMRERDSVPFSSELPNLSASRATRTTFEAGASAKNNDQVDIWTINHRKELVHFQDGFL